MRIISLIFEPMVFLGVLVVIFVVSMFVIRSFTREDKKLAREKAKR